MIFTLSHHIDVQPLGMIGSFFRMIYQTRYDIIFIGGGLANCLAAYRLWHANPKIRVLIIEKGVRLCGDKTWSFHKSDLRYNKIEEALEWLSAFNPTHWHGYKVQFENSARSLNGDYLSIDAACVRNVLEAATGIDTIYNQTAQPLHTGDGVKVSDGQIIYAKTLVQATGAALDGRYRGGYQKFLGLKLRLKNQHNLTQPIIMDASVEQHGSFRFVYVLPYLKNELLIEDTYYSSYPEFSEALLRQRIESYAASKQWQIERILYEEKGCLPIPIAPQSQNKHVTNLCRYCNETDSLYLTSGMQAGLFHPTTGYSIPEAIRFAQWLAEQISRPRKHVYSASKLYYIDFFKRLMFYWRINNMLFCSGQPDKRHLILEGFYRLPERVIERFYALQFTRADQARLICIGRSSVPFIEGVKAFYRHAEVKHDYHQDRVISDI